MNRRRPTTAGTDQLSLNLSVTRSPGGSVLASILLWSLGTLRGGVTAAVLFCLAGYLETASGMAQCRGPALAALGGLCDGGNLLTMVGGTSVGGGAGLVGTAEAGDAIDACPSAVPDTAGLSQEAPLPPGPLSAVPGETRLLGGCVGVYPNLGMLMRHKPAPLCSLLNLLMTSSCSSGALSGSCPITMYRWVRKLI